jgi:uncharacterized protein (DUF983 family)
VDPRAIRAEYQKLFNGFRSELQAECLGHGIDYRLARSDDSPARLLSAWLAGRASAQGLRGGR